MIVRTLSAKYEIDQAAKRIRRTDLQPKQRIWSNYVEIFNGPKVGKRFVVQYIGGNYCFSGIVKGIE